MKITGITGRKIISKFTKIIRKLKAIRFTYKVIITIAITWATATNLKVSKVKLKVIRKFYTHINRLY